MPPLDVFDYSKLAGFLVLIGAAFLATVTVPRIQQKLSDLTDALAHLRDSRMLSAICIVNYAEQFTRRRIELFEANHLQLSGGPPNAAQDLRQRALNQTIELAKQWAVLLAGEAAQQQILDVETQVATIMNDDSIDRCGKLDATERIWLIRKVLQHQTWLSAFSYQPLKTALFCGVSG